MKNKDKKINLRKQTFKRKSNSKKPINLYGGGPSEIARITEPDNVADIRPSSRGELSQTISESQRRVNRIVFTFSIEENLDNDENENPDDENENTDEDI